MHDNILNGGLIVDGGFLYMKINEQINSSIQYEGMTGENLWF